MSGWRFAAFEFAPATLLEPPCCAQFSACFRQEQESAILPI